VPKISIVAVYHASAGVDASFAFKSSAALIAACPYLFIVILRSDMFKVYAVVQSIFSLTAKVYYQLQSLEGSWFQIYFTVIIP